MTDIAAVIARIHQVNQLAISLGEHVPIKPDADGVMTWHWGPPTHPLFDCEDDWNDTDVLAEAPELEAALSAYRAAMASRQRWKESPWPVADSDSTLYDHQNDDAFNALFKAANQLS